MSNLQTVVTDLIADGGFRKVIANPLAQFGREGRRYVGATLLPEQTVPDNKYKEIAIKYRTVLANDGTRYSPAQKKGNDIVGEMDVELEHQDIAAEYTAADYDLAVQISKLNNLSENTGNPTLVGVTQLTNWFITKIQLPLIEKIEKMRWEAMVGASIALSGDNGYIDTVTYPNPAGHRAGANGTWSSDAYDPMADIFAMMELAATKGYAIGRIVASNPVIFKLLNNAKVKAAVGGYIGVSGGALVSVTGRLTLANVNDYLMQHSLPGIEPYNLQYRTQTGSGFFLPQDVFTMFATTERDVEIDLGDNEYLPMRSVLGYVGVGRAAGQDVAGRATWQQYYGDKPPRMDAQGWQATLPVVTDPESIFVINSIS